MSLRSGRKQGVSKISTKTTFYGSTEGVKTLNACVSSGFPNKKTPPFGDGSVQ